jgi:predicted PurR-regulated permease PerM
LSHFGVSNVPIASAADENSNAISALSFRPKSERLSPDTVPNASLGPGNEHASFIYRDARRLVGLILLLIIGWFLIRAVAPVLLLFAIVLLLAMVFNPVVVMLERHRIRRGLATGIIVIAVIILLGLVILVAGRTLLDQIQELVKRLPSVAAAIQRQIGALAAQHPLLQNALPQAEQVVNTLGSEFGGLAAFLIRSTYNIVGVLFAAFFGFLLFIFVLSNPRPLVAGYLALVPDSQRDRARRALTRMMRQMTAWARGVAINGVITGISTGVLLWLIGVQPAMLFGTLTFLGALVPTVGPVIMALPALFVALSLGFTKFLLALACVLFVQQVESTLLVPFVLGREMRLNPAVILFSTLTMGSIFGIAGAMLSVPTAAFVSILVDEFYLRPRQLNYAALDRDASALVEGKDAPLKPR